MSVWRAHPPASLFLLRHATTSEWLELVTVTVDKATLEIFLAIGEQLSGKSDTHRL